MTRWFIISGTLTMEDYGKQIEILQKTRGLLQSINNSTESVYKDLVDIKQNNESMKDTTGNSVSIIKNMEDSDDDK